MDAGAGATETVSGLTAATLYSFTVRAYDAAGTRRSNGSTAKPFVYATALEQGMSPCDKMVDEVRTHAYQENGERKTWTRV